MLNIITLGPWHELFEVKAIIDWIWVRICGRECRAPWTWILSSSTCHIYKLPQSIISNLIETWRCSSVSNLINTITNSTRKGPIYRIGNGIKWWREGRGGGDNGRKKNEEKMYHPCIPYLSPLYILYIQPEPFYHVWNLSEYIGIKYLDNKWYKFSNIML